MLNTIRMSIMDYTLHKTTPEDDDKVEDFIYNNFFPEMPLIKMFGLHNKPPPRAPPRHKKDSKDFTVKAVDSEGNIIGIAINRVHVSFNMDSETPPEVKKVKASILQRHINHVIDQVHIKKSRTVEMVEFLNFAEEEAELSKLPEKTIELRVLSVREDWRQRGVARRLAEESMRLAREEGFTTMKVCCTSEFTAKLVRSLGWREHYRLAYKDYPRLSGTDVYLKTYPPHELFYYYVTDL